MNPIVECVPNFSNGRDRAVIDAIAASLGSVPGATLLDVDPGAATNRTVMTVIGSPDAVVEAAFRAIKTASERIDMTQHSGAHARMGATDVCPFIPVRDATMDGCAELARWLGARVGVELDLPVFLYEHAASRPERRNLADVRAGEYEGLADRFAGGEEPDFGPARCGTAGATAIGARKFLIAYNLNLNTRDRMLAQKIAFHLRERGRPKRDASGAPIKGADGQMEWIPGLLKATKAVGWVIEEYGRAQISMNLVDWEVTPPHVAFDTACEVANRFGVRVTGSELVGLVPLEPMRQAGRHYLVRQGRSAGVPEAELVRTAVLSMGLDELAHFDVGEKVLDYRVAQDGPLVSMSLRAFTDTTSTEAPAPGGGSVAALCGALAAALAAMVANLTAGKRAYAAVAEEMKSVAWDGQQLKDRLLRAIDDDTAAFDAVMAAGRLPKGTTEEKAARARALDAANRRAVDVPLSVLEAMPAALALIEVVAARGNPNCASDGAAAAAAALAAAEGAHLNVLINLPSVRDEAWRKQTLERADVALAETRTRSAAVVGAVREELLSQLG